ncbi:M48 family metalloprotease [Nocardia sp. NPDC004722]
MIIRSLGTADAAARAAYRRQLRREALPWSIGMLFVSWPIPLLTALLLYRLGDLLAPWAAYAVPGVWLSSGSIPLLLTRFPGPSDPVPGSHPRLPRRPTSAEAEVLDPGWHRNMRNLGLADATYAVWVWDSPRPLGSAYPDGLIVVSAEAVRDYTSMELRGLLGHEIGHLVGDAGGLWYRLSWWYGGLLRNLVGVVGRVAGWLTRGRRLLQPVAVLSADLGVLLGLSVLLCSLFGTVAAAALMAAAAVQMVGQRAVRRRNQLNADRVAVDLGAGPGVRSIILRTNRPASLRPRGMNSLGSRVVLACLTMCLSDPWPDRQWAALEARMLANYSSRQDPPGPGWLERLGGAVRRPLWRLGLWTMTAPTPNHLAAKRRR